MENVIQWKGQTAWNDMRDSRDAWKTYRDSTDHHHQLMARVDDQFYHERLNEYVA